MGPKAERERAWKTAQELDPERERLIEDALNKLFIEKERHPEAFLHDLVIVITTYLRDREINITVDDIMSSWKKPSVQKKGAAQIFFSERIFPSFYKATIDERELDYLALAFFMCVGKAIALPVCARLTSAEELGVRDASDI